LYVSSSKYDQREETTDERTRRIVVYEYMYCMYRIAHEPPYVLAQYPLLHSAEPRLTPTSTRANNAERAYCYDKLEHAHPRQTLRPSHGSGSRGYDDDKAVRGRRDWF
jgi:hypothetical protein